MSPTTAAVKQQAFPVASARSHASDRAFFHRFSIAFLLIALIGFGPSYYFLGLTDRPSLPGIVHVHGAVFTAWLVLLVVQTSLIVANRRDIHRKLGIASVALAVAMVAIGTLTAIARIQQGGVGPGGMPLLAFSAVPLLSIWSFAAIFGAAVYFRNRADIHKRLIMITSIDMLGAATARIASMIDAGFAGLLLFPVVLLAVLAAYDYYSRGRIHEVTLWVGGYIALSQYLRLVIGSTEQWQSFVTGIMY